MVYPVGQGGPSYTPKNSSLPDPSSKAVKEAYMKRIGAKVKGQIAPGSAGEINVKFTIGTDGVIIKNSIEVAVKGFLDNEKLEKSLTISLKIGASDVPKFKASENESEGSFIVKVLNRG